MSHTVTAIFKTRSDAEKALWDLESKGFTEEQISIVVTDETRGKTFNIEEGTKADEGAAAGATMGGIVGGILAAVTSAGTLAVPGLNLVVTGAMAAGLAGAGAGGAAGGLIGALVGAGIPEHEAKRFEDEVRAGNILLAVESDSDKRAELVEEILNGTDAYKIAA